MIGRAVYHRHRAGAHAGVHVSDGLVVGDGEHELIISDHVQAADGVSVSGVFSGNHQARQRAVAQQLFLQAVGHHLGNEPLGLARAAVYRNQAHHLVHVAHDGVIGVAHQPAVQVHVVPCHAKHVGGVRNPHLPAVVGLIAGQLFLLLLKEQIQHQILIAVILQVLFRQGVFVDHVQKFVQFGFTVFAQSQGGAEGQAQRQHPEYQLFHRLYPSICFPAAVAFFEMIIPHAAKIWKKEKNGGAVIFFRRGRPPQPRFP